MMICDYLKVFPNVGILIYGRRVSTPLPVFVLNSAALQLVGSKILKVDSSHNKDNDDNEYITISLRLNHIFECDMEFLQLTCTIDSYWGRL